MPHFYQKHICRLPEWPDGLSRAFKHANGEIYTLMQGPSEFGISWRLANWDIKNRLRDNCAHPDDWRQVRHHGPQSNGRTKQVGQKRALSLLSKWEPFIYVGRPKSIYDWRC